MVIAVIVLFLCCFLIDNLCFNNSLFAFLSSLFSAMLIPFFSPKYCSIFSTYFLGCLYCEKNFFLLLLWQTVLLGITFYAGHHGLLGIGMHCFRLFWLSDFPLRKSAVTLMGFSLVAFNTFSLYVYLVL